MDDTEKQSNQPGWKKEVGKGKAERENTAGQSTPATSKLPLPGTTSSAGSSPSHDFSFTISFHSPSAAKSPSALGRCGAFDLSPADDIFFHGHLLPLQILTRAPHASSSRMSHGGGLRDEDGGPSPGDAAADAAAGGGHNNSSSSSSSSGASSNGDVKERGKNKFLSSLFVGKWRKSGGGNGGGREEEEEKRRKGKAFDAMSKLLRRYMSAVEPIFSFRGGRGRRGEPLKQRPYSFAGNPSADAAARRATDWRRRRGELSAPASMRTSPTNSGLLVAPPPNIGGSSDESTMEELRSAIEAAIAHCKNSIAMKEEKCKC